MLKRGSIVDATIIAAPSWTKNAASKCEPEVHQTKKGNQWHFGLKAHIWMGADSGLAHTVATTPMNQFDVEQVPEAQRGKEEVVDAEAGYAGTPNQVMRKGLGWEIAAKRDRVNARKDGRPKRSIGRLERHKAIIRTKLEHVFRGDQAPGRACEHAFPETGEEHVAHAHALYLLRLVDGVPTIAGDDWSMCPQLAK